MKLQTALQGTTYSFKDLKELFGKANEEKSGDSLVGLGARTVSERIAAKIVLSELTLEEIRNNPLIPDDEVTRIIEADVNETIYDQYKNMTVGELREYLLSHKTRPTDIEILRKGLTAEMIAAVTKIMGNMDLVYAAQKMRVTAKCKYEIGKEGTLSVRIQSNHPQDDPKGLRASIYEGLSYASGDCVIGINPVEDNVESCSRTLQTIYDVIDKFDIPTHNCVLAHMSTQIRAVKNGAPASMIFQSVAGTEVANTEFGVNADLIDEAFEVVKKCGLSTGPNLLYFETGQGSEVSLGAHCGVDEMTLEARTYGYAKHWQPFIVNNATGFIGPETIYDGKQLIRSNLEDHFMGKLSGLPMGMAPCFTNHAVIDQNDQEAVTMLLALAGSNYYMGIPCGDDVMLSYMDTSYHDDATLREMLNRTPAPEFFEWSKAMGILDEKGRLTERAGDATMFM